MTTTLNGKLRRTPRSSITNLRGSLPKASIPEDVDAAAAAASCLAHFPNLSISNVTHDALWRDTFALTGTLRTFFSADSVLDAWKETASKKGLAGIILVPHGTRVMRFGESAWIDAAFAFETDSSTCSGFLSVVPDGNNEGGWKIWMIRTILETVKGQGNVDVLGPRADDVLNDVESTHFDCVVVGGGQAGLSTAGRLKALGVSYVVIDKYSSVGDSWNSRYDSMKLHTLREYAHLPFERTFGPEHPELLPKQVLAIGYQKWVKKFGINVWTSTSLISCSWAAESKSWTLNIHREGQDLTITAIHVIFAVGHAQRPYMPNFPGRETFRGTVMHSADYKSPAQWKGKPGVVVGTGNTAHDVAEDMVDAGLSSVTMVQRGRTWVLPVENYQRAQGPIYNAGMPTELSDRILRSSPVAINRQLAMLLLHGMAREQGERFDALEQAGFKAERYGDVEYVLCERLGGHYMDVGASDKIAKGLIKIKSDALIECYTPNGLKFSDGSELPADLIVFTTGFRGNMREAVGKFVGAEIEDQLEDFWGLDAEGELLGAFKWSGHPRLWYVGGDIGYSRYYSRFVAMQVKADLTGAPFERYTKIPSADFAIVNGDH